MNTLKQNKILRCLQWLLVVVAYGYLIYRLATYDDWSSLTDHFSSAGVFQYFCFIAAVMLFPLNILFEAMKWRYLMSELEVMSLREAQRQTYFGFIGAFLTPGRMGDYPTRATMMKRNDLWLESFTLGYIGTLALAFLQVLVGFPSCIILLERLGGFRWFEWLCGGILLLLFMLIVLYQYLATKLMKNREEGRIRNTLEIVSRFSHKRFLITILLSSLRYSVYCLQLWFVMSFCGIILSAHDSLIAIPAYYLLVTVTPSVPVADAAVRGGWSVVIFSLFTPDIAAIAIAAILLWMLNTILPMLVGTIMPQGRLHSDTDSSSKCNHSQNV